MTRRILACAIALGAVLATTPASQARAQSSEEVPSVLVRAGGGVLLPQPFNEMKTNFLVDLGLGVVLPPLDGRFAIVGDVAYTQPHRTESLDDPRLTEGGSYKYTLIQHDLKFFVGAHYHFLPMTETFIPYVGLGFRIHVNKSEIDGKAGENELGTNEETSTGYGGALRLGGGLKAGPGFVMLEAELDYAPIDHLVTGDDNIANLAIMVGYTLAL